MDLFKAVKDESQLNKLIISIFDALRFKVYDWIEANKKLADKDLLRGAKFQIIENFKTFDIHRVNNLFLRLNKITVNSHKLINYILNSPLMNIFLGNIERYINRMRKQNNTKGLKHWQELLDIDEPKKTEWDTDSSFSVDFPNRDFPFVYINGELIIGKHSTDIHADLIRQYFQEHNIQDRGLIEKNHIRSMNDIPQLDSTLPVALGHICKDLAFVETVLNMSIDEIVSKLADKYRKVYDYQYSNNKVIRLAKLNQKINK